MGTRHSMSALSSSHNGRATGSFALLVRNSAEGAEDLIQ